MRTIHRDCVVGIILSRDRQLLMGHKDPQGGGVYADCWHLPGGGIEADESPVAALKREMQEEVGLTIDAATVKFISDSGRGVSEKQLKDTQEIVWCEMKFFVYRIDLPQKASDVLVKPGDDIQEARWFPLSSLLEQKLTPPSREFFAVNMHLLD